MTQPEMHYVETAIGVKSKRNVVRSMEAVREQAASGEWQDRECYLSVYRYPRSYQEHLDRTGSVSGYLGTVGLDSVVFDIDRKGDPVAALDAARTLVGHLRDRYGVPLDHVRVLASGMKGYHVYLPASLLGEVPTAPRPDHGPVKTFALRIAADAGLPSGALDASVYSQNALIRMPGTRHQETGRYVIDVEDVFAATPGEIEARSRVAPSVCGPWNPPQTPCNEALAALFQKCLRLEVRKRNVDRPSFVADGNTTKGATISHVVRPYWQRGVRWDLASCVSGLAATEGVCEEECLAGLLALRLADDQEKKIRDAVRSSYERVANDAPTRGFGGLEALLGRPAAIAIDSAIRSGRTSGSRRARSTGGSAKGTPPAACMTPEEAVRAMALDQVELILSLVGKAGRRWIPVPARLVTSAIRMAEAGRATAVYAQWIKRKVMRANAKGRPFSRKVGGRHCYFLCGDMLTG
jgi:hypothetical protein